MFKSILSRAGLGAAIASLALAGIAAAKAGDKTFQKTYPVASQLCARAAANGLGAGLRPETANVVAACNRLQGGFGPLQSAVLSAQSTFAAGQQSTRAAIRAACAKGQPRPACREARRQGRATLRGLRIQHRAAVRTYSVGIEANRRTFWTTIHSLRGGEKIKADKRIAPLTN